MRGGQNHFFPEKSLERGYRVFGPHISRFYSCVFFVFHVTQHSVWYSTSTCVAERRCVLQPAMTGWFSTPQVKNVTRELPDPYCALLCLPPPPPSCQNLICKIAFHRYVHQVVAQPPSTLTLMTKSRWDRKKRDFIDEFWAFNVWPPKSEILSF